MAIYNPYYQNQNYNGTGTYPLSYQNTSQFTQQLQNVITGIQGIDAAKAYPLGPNTRGYFFDTEKDFLYIKETDQNGFPKNLKIYSCKEVSEDSLKNPEPEHTLPSNVVTVDMLDGLLAKYLDEHSYKPYIPRKERKNE